MLEKFIFCLFAVGLLFQSLMSRHSIRKFIWLEYDGALEQNCISKVKRPWSTRLIKLIGSRKHLANQNSRKPIQLPENKTSITRNYREWPVNTKNKPWQNFRLFLKWNKENRTSRDIKFSISPIFVNGLLTIYFRRHFSLTFWTFADTTWFSMYDFQCNMVELKTWPNYCKSGLQDLKIVTKTARLSISCWLSCILVHNLWGRQLLVEADFELETFIDITDASRALHKWYKITSWF